MSLAHIYTRAQDGIRATEVIVEVHITNGLPSLSIVGMPEMAVRESKDRVRGALINSRFDFPPRRVTINLAPADLPKEGGRFDLPIALGILVASGQLPAEQLDRFEFTGELALSGELRNVRGILPMSMACKHSRRHLVCPVDNAAEAALVSDVSVLGARHLLDVCAHLTGEQSLATMQAPLWSVEKTAAQPDMAEVLGQQHAKRALEIAAAGGHSLLMVGPPGTGKTMLSSRLPGIMPDMTETEALETAAIASISSVGLNPHTWRQRPFRSPHHTASAVALVGGGSNPRPGEVSLAHNGIMFLDELPEFDRKVLEVLREPMESGTIMISRAARQAEYPARFQLVAAMNPCPCGYLGDARGRCHCTHEQVMRYRQKISGPLMDRIDIHLQVPAQSAGELRQQPGGETSTTVRKRVVAARAIQLQQRRRTNAQLDSRQIRQYCTLTSQDQSLLDQAMERLGLSMRAQHKALKVARTIADLDASEVITTPHLTEALSYRVLDRQQA